MSLAHKISSFPLDEARKQFKTYVNILASIKNEGNEKYLILRKKYINELPTEDTLLNSSNILMSPGSRSSASFMSDGEGSPFKQPPPYRPPPQVSSPLAAKPLPFLEQQTHNQFKDWVNEFKDVVTAIGANRNPTNVSEKPELSRTDSSDSRKSASDSRKNSTEMFRGSGQELVKKNSIEMYKFDEGPAPAIPPRKRFSEDKGTISREVSVEEKTEVPVNMATKPPVDESNKENLDEKVEENKLSVKEKMMKFNRYASEEEAKVPSPMGKKPEKKVGQTIFY